MPTARKLPSGNYRVRIFSHVDSSGKKIYESFTAPTKAEAEKLASDWNSNRKARPTDITVGSATDNYIKAKRGVLSPSTIRGYNVCRKRFDGIENLKLRNVTTARIQPWVSELSAELSWKTVQNTYGLLTAVLKYYAPGTTLAVKLPPKTKRFYDLPSDEDIQKLLDHTEGTELWTALMLARYYSLRRSEICALNKTDLKDNILTVHRASILNEDGDYVIKETPKTYSSYRRVLVADPLLSALKAGLFVSYSPGTLSDRFHAALKATGVKPFNFHLLRHVFASKAALNGIPDFYTAKMGGWEQNSSVLKEIYQNVQESDLFEQMSRLNVLMQKEYDTKYDTKNDQAHRPGLFLFIILFYRSLQKLDDVFRRCPASSFPFFNRPFRDVVVISELLL